MMTKMKARTMRGMTIPNAIATAFELDMDSDSEIDCAVETGGPPVVVRVVPELALDVGTKWPICEVIVGLLACMLAESDGDKDVTALEGKGVKKDPGEESVDDVSNTGVRGLFLVPINVIVEFGLNITNRSIWSNLTLRITRQPKIYCWGGCRKFAPPNYSEAGGREVPFLGAEIPMWRLPTTLWSTFLEM